MLARNSPVRPRTAGTFAKSLRERLRSIDSRLQRVKRYWWAR